MKTALLALLACMPMVACGAAASEDSSPGDGSSITASERLTESTTGSVSLFDGEGRPVVGRLKMRDETLPLTAEVVDADRRLDTMQARKVMADIDTNLTGTADEPNLPGTQRSF